MAALFAYENQKGRPYEPTSGVSSGEAAPERGRAVAVGIRREAGAAGGGSISNHIRRGAERQRPRESRFAASGRVAAADEVRFDPALGRAILENGADRTGLPRGALSNSAAPIEGKDCVAAVERTLITVATYNEIENLPRLLE